MIQRDIQYNDNSIPVPRSISQQIKLNPGLRLHPGLRIDRLFGWSESREFNQQWQKVFLQTACKNQNMPDPQEKDSLDSALDRRAWILEAAGSANSRSLEMRTIWRLAAHLSRTSTLENGNTCLHPLYGFFFLPGSGLKGMARAYATRKDTPRSIPPSWDTEDIKRVMGSEPSEARGAEDLVAGRVAFLDGLPRAIPRLMPDICNNHHALYYQVGGPPGDWEAPIPIYFLTVAPDTRFRFDLVHLGGESEAEVKRDLDLACHWLRGALTELGAGAKTAAGYGYFDEAPPPKGRPQSQPAGGKSPRQARLARPARPVRPQSQPAGGKSPAAVAIKPREPMTAEQIKREISEMNHDRLDALIDGIGNRESPWGEQLIAYLLHVLYGQSHVENLKRKAQANDPDARRRLAIVKSLPSAGKLRI